MISHETHVRVRYADTDQMGYVYYGKYPEYLEVGRVEMIRHLGIPYTEIEAKGIMLPVADLRIQYKHPARYDDELRILTRIPQMPSSSFLTEYEIYSPTDKLLAEAYVKLAFIDMERNRPVRIPDFIREAIESHWPIDNS